MEVRRLALTLVLLGPSVPRFSGETRAPVSPASPPLVAHTLLLDAALAGNAVIAVGERGVIVRSEDNARAWTAIASHTEAALTGVTFANETTGWAVGHDGLILTTHDGGRSWTKQWQSETVQDSFLDVAALDAKHAIAVGGYGLYVATDDGGLTWTRGKPTPEDYHLNRIVAGRDLYIAGEHGTLLHSTDGGASWHARHVPYEGSLYGVLKLGAHELIVYGLRGRVFHSDDDGENWMPVATDESWLIAAGVRLADGSVALAGNGRTLLYSQDARRSFVARDVDAPAAIAEVLVLPDGNLLAVGEAGAERIELARVRPRPTKTTEVPK